MTNVIAGGVLAATGLDRQIAVDLAGHTADARPQLFAARCAPVQVDYFGLPGASGHPCMEYLIADPAVVPPDHDTYYDEAVVRRPHTYLLTDTTCRPAPDRGTRRAARLPEAGFVFACFNRVRKILPELFETWMRLLAEVPGSVLWLTPGEAGDALRAAAAGHGIDPERLISARFTPRREDYPARATLADL